MSIFGTIVSKIFGKAKPAETLPAEPIAPALRKRRQAHLSRRRSRTSMSRP